MTLIVGTTGDYYPFSFSSQAPNGPLKGLDIDLARLLAVRLKTDLTFKKIPWSEVNQAWAQEIHLVMSGITISDDRQRYGIFTRPYLQSRSVLLSRIDQASFNLEQDAHRFKVAVNRGGYLEGVARSKWPGASIIAVTENQELPDYLLTHRADLVLTDSLEAKSFLQRGPIKQVAALETQLYGALVNPAYQEYVHQFNDFLANELPHIEAIMDKWSVLGEFQSLSSRATGA